MTPQQFKAWRLGLGLSQQAAADALGRGRRQIVAYEREGADIPLTVRLACAAVAMGVTDYPPGDDAPPQ